MCKGIAEDAMITSADDHIFADLSYELDCFSIYGLVEQEDVGAAHSIGPVRVGGVVVSKKQDWDSP
jgi:hypothetical protein